MLPMVSYTAKVSKKLMSFAYGLLFIYFSHKLFVVPLALSNSVTSLYLLTDFDEPLFLLVFLWLLSMIYHQSYLYK